MALTKLNNSLYHDHIKKILKEDADLDSDNSEDEEEFKFDRSDAMELRKRNKILTFELWSEQYSLLYKSYGWFVFIFYIFIVLIILVTPHALQSALIE